MSLVSVTEDEDVYTFTIRASKQFLLEAGVSGAGEMVRILRESAERLTAQLLCTTHGHLPLVGWVCPRCFESFEVDDETL